MSYLALYRYGDKIRGILGHRMIVVDHHTGIPSIDVFHIMLYCIA